MTVSGDLRADKLNDTSDNENRCKKTKGYDESNYRVDKIIPFRLDV